MRYLFTIVVLALCLQASAQGVFDVRFNINSVDCENSLAFIDLEIRANDATTEFNLADQNYRFSFTRDIIDNAAIVTELTLSGALADSNGDFSAYDPHTIQGTADTIVSYNVVHAFGPGYYTTTDWLPIGRLSFDILDPTGCTQLMWHDLTPELFPNTYASELLGGTLSEMNQGNIYTNYTLCIPDFCPLDLPIDLVRFTAKAVDCSAELSWVTASEVNNDYFEVQKSLDGSFFETIAVVKSKGDSEVETKYTYTDMDIKEQAYYRLRQVDFDGKVSFSQNREVKSDCFEGYASSINALFPNPAGNEMVSIRFFSEWENDAQIVITDVAGKIVLEQAAAVNAGSNILQFDASTLSQGSYMIQVKSATWSSASRKFIKIK